MDVNAIGQRIPPVPAPAEPRHRPAPVPAADAPEPFAAPPGPPPPPDLKFTLRSADVEARFAIHEATGCVTVTIYDRSTGEVIREIPPRRYLDLVAALSGRGAILDRSG